MPPGHPGNVLLRTIREAHGYRSQRGFAEALNAAAREKGLGELSITPRTVRRWESASPPRPQRAHAEALELVLGCSLDELGFGHRTVPGDITADPAGPAPGAPHQVTDDFPDTVTDDYTTLTSTYRRLCATASTLALQPSVRAHAHFGAALVAAATDDQRTAVAAAAARAWLLLGRIEFFDAHSPAAAAEALAKVLGYAHISADEALAAATLAHVALVSADTPPNPAPASEQLRMARAFARRAGNPPHLDAWLDITEAQIALTAGAVDTALTLVAKAETALQTPPDPNLDWLDWLSPSRVASLQGAALLAAGRTVEARSTLDRALRQLPPTATKAHVLLLTDMAEIAAFEAEPDRAAALLTDAIDTARTAGLTSAAGPILEARRSLSAWDDTPALRALDDHLIKWRPTLGARP